MSQSSSSTNLSSLLTTDEHREYLLNLIRQWCIDNKESFQLNELELKEKEHFNFLFSNINGVPDASIQCKCNSKISLVSKEVYYIFSCSQF